MPRVTTEAQLLVPCFKLSRSGPGQCSNGRLLGNMYATLGSMLAKKWDINAKKLKAVKWDLAAAA